MSDAVSGREPERKQVLVGHVSGVQGLKGWVRVHSLTDPREAIWEYQPWLLGVELEAVHILQARKHGKHLLVLLENIDGREQAEALIGQSIAVYRDELPELGEDEFYWLDLIGLAVQLDDGRELGVIDRMLATGANDVMVVRGDKERLIPFVTGQYVKKVDLEAGAVVVDWDPEF
ncbi:MAG: ribosome maturation factor RimM [Xanthomonadales bacterium]|nr:ribosome maturation factor RimM [Xanthomonadales bacterium]